jgi:hypothetical protein
MMFPDLLQRFLPVALLPDRAETLERSWEEAWAVIDPAAPSAAMMGEPFLNLAPKANEPWRPILIVQGTSEDSGRRFLTSGVRFGCDEVDADDFLDSVGHDVAASTAILNGARFPYISPGGTFAAQRCERDGTRTDHILDGGYFDNAGAETLRETVRALRVIRAAAHDEDPLRIVFVLIGYHDPDAAKPTPAIPPKGRIVKIASPTRSGEPDTRAFKGNAGQFGRPFLAHRDRKGARERSCCDNFARNERRIERVGGEQLDEMLQRE